VKEGSDAHVADLRRRLRLGETLLDATEEVEGLVVAIAGGELRRQCQLILQ
jgi:hypothetical protein